MPTLTRPMFSEQAQNGGIVSTIPPEAQGMPPEARPQVQAQAQDMMGSSLQGPIDAAVAEEVAATNMEIDSSETIDEMLAAMGGTATSTEAARTELAAVVGEQDANSTPESVLPLTQTTLQLIAAVEDTNGQGGLGNLLGAPGELMASTMGGPMGDPTNPLAAPTMDIPAEGFQPMVGFALGGLNAPPTLGTAPIYSMMQEDNNPLIQPLVPQLPMDSPSTVQTELPQFRGDVPYPPEGTGQPELVRSLWDIPYPDAAQVTPESLGVFTDYYEGVVEKSLPKVTPVDKLVGRRRERLQEFIPKIETAEEILEKRKELMGEYLTDSPEYEEVLAEYQKDYGDVQKDLETQGWLQLAKFGANIAKSNKSTFYAVASALPDLADGMAEAAQKKSTIDREIRTEARSEYRQLQALRNQEEIALAQGSFEEARALKKDSDEINRGLVTEAITRFELESTERARMANDLQTGALQWGAARAEFGAEAENAFSLGEQAAKETFAQLPPEYFVAFNEETGEYDIPMAGRMMPHGLFDLNGNYVDRLIRPIDASEYARMVGSTTPDLQQKSVLMFGPEWGDNGVGQFGAAWDANTGLWYFNDPKNNHALTRIPDDATWSPGTMQDAVTVSTDSTGRTSMVSLYTGEVMLTRAVDKNGNLVTVTSPKDVAVDPGHPFSKRNDAPGVKWESMDPSRRGQIISELNDYEAATKGLEDLMGSMQLYTGPEAGFRRLGTQISAFLPKGRWDDWYKNVSIDAGTAQWKLMIEALVRAQVPSTRYPEGQVQYVRQELAEMPDPFRDPDAAYAKILELARNSKNNYSRAIAQVNNTPYYTMDRVPSGGLNDALNLADSRVKRHINRLLTASDPREAQALDGAWVFYPVPQGSEDIVKSILAERAPDGVSPRHGIEWSDDISGPQHRMPRGIWAQKFTTQRIARIDLQGGTETVFDVSTRAASP